LTILAALVALVAGSCSEDESDPVAPVLPVTGGSLVNSESSIGNPSLATSIDEMVSDGNVGFYFSGSFNDDLVVGKLATDGTVVWTTSTGFTVLEIVRMPAASGALANALIAVGSRDTDGDGEVDEGVVTLYSQTGTALDTLVYNGTDDEWLSSAIVTVQTPPTSFVLVAVGGTNASGVIQPVTVRFGVISPGTLTKLERNVLADTDAAFWQIVSTTGQPIAGYVVLVNRGTSEFENSEVWHLTDLLTVTWRLPVSVTGGTFPFLQDAHWINNTLVAVGNARVGKRGNNWRAALAASISQVGTENWTKLSIFSDYSDRFTDCFVAGNELFASGGYGAFRWVNTGRFYGLGLMARIDPSTGATTTSRTFGNSDYDSRFNVMFTDGTLANTGGWTNRTTEDSGYQGWLTEINVMDMTASLLAPLPAPTVQFAPQASKTPGFRDQVP